MASDCVREAQGGFRGISLMERAVRPWDGLPREVWSHPSCHHRVKMSFPFASGRSEWQEWEREGKAALPAKEGDSERIWDGAKVEKEAKGSLQSDPKG